MKQRGLFDTLAEAEPAPPEPAREPADARDRAQAVGCFDRPVFLEAGAGTGKTAILVARIIAWCQGPGWEEARARAPEASADELALSVLRGVVAITFTEAAAAEMATRIGQALAHLSRAASAGTELAPRDLPHGLAREDLPARTAEVLERSRALRASLDHLNASTIHAFCRRVLAAHPLEVGLDPAFRLDTGAGVEIVVREVLEAYLREAWSDPVDPELLALARDGFGPPELEEALVGLILDKGARAGDLARDPFDAETCERLLRELDASQAELHELAACFETVTRAEVTVAAADATARTRSVLDDLSGTTLADVEAACAALRGVWSEKLGKRVKEWGKGGLNKGEEKAVGAGKEALVAAAGRFSLALEPFLEMKPAFLERARRIFHAVLGRIEAELRRRGLSTFEDLLRDTRDLLAGNPEIAAMERARIRQLLVDEFQDTDALQCEIVRSIGLEGDPADRPGLFVVGDPKQSIYAWRNADLAAYERFARDMEAAGGVGLSLTCNFRSVPAVLDEVERAIAAVMEEVPETQPPFVPLSPWRDAAASADPRVEYWVSWPRGDDGAIRPEIGQRRLASYETEARALARDLLARRGAEPRPRWKDFGLLFRSTTELETYLHELRKHGIPYEVQSDKNYYQRREVIDVTALVRCVLDPNDHLALVTLCRSPMVGVPDAALLPLWEAGFPGKVSWLRGPSEERLRELEELVRAAAERVPASVPGIEGITGWEESMVAALHALALARQSFREDPADRWIERLRELFLPEAIEAARFLGGYRLANVQRFFRELLRAMEERAGDTQSVLRTLRANLARERELESSRPADSGQDAVQVLTMHGAKGLEFEHVYLAHLHRPPRVDSDSRTDFDRRGERAAYRLFGAPSPSWFLSKHERDQAESAERVRLLYVAMTRAQERLVLLGGWSLSPKRRSWRRAATFADLLESRPGHGEAVVSLAQHASNESPEPWTDEFGVAWVLAAGLDGEPAALASDAPSAGPPAPDEVVRISESLAAERARAARRSARPFSTAASAESHAEGIQARAERRFAEEDAEAPSAAPIARDAAQAAGTAVHRLLELIDLDAEPETELARLRPELERSVADLDGKEAAQALERAQELLERMRANGTLARLAALRGGIVARELPVLLPPGNADDQPVGFVSGAIDLLYRDPATGDLVVADYKTDDVETPDEIAVRIETYRPQGRAYARAVRAALGLDREPRFELWFLRAGRVELV